MIDGKTGYLRILEFSKSTYLSISKALDNLSAKGMQKLIIDLRNNPGGDVDSALAIADLFVSNSDLMYLTYKDHSKNGKFSASSTVAVQPDVDIAILINGGTASSAELFSSMMRDTGRAVIVGSKSFGKGVMQLVSTFGDGFISLTTASFTGPKEVPINKEGVLPDIEVEDIYVTEEEVKAYTDLINNDVDLKFVEANPEFSDENIHKFAEQNASSGLREIVLLLIARNAYISEMNYDERPLFDIKYDVVCKAAYDYLQTYETSYGAAGGNGRNVVNF
jgi:carboxyl-terminal processing protease